MMEEDSLAIHLVNEKLRLFAACGMLVLVDDFLCVCRPKQLLGVGHICYMICPGPCMKEGASHFGTAGFRLSRSVTDRQLCIRFCSARSEVFHAAAA